MSTSIHFKFVHSVDKISTASFVTTATPKARNPNSVIEHSVAVSINRGPAPKPKFIVRFSNSGFVHSVDKQPTKWFAPKPTPKVRFPNSDPGHSVTVSMNRGIQSIYGAFDAQRPH
jgi:hypothetical protein